MSNADPVIKFPGAACTMPGRRLPPLPKSWKNLVKAVVRTARRVPDKIFAYDSDGTSITFKDTVRGATALSCALQRRVGKGGNIGVLMPPCIAGALANLSTVMSGNAVVNLNLLSEQITNGVIADAKITYTITSKKVMEKLNHPKLDCQIIYLEDLREEITQVDRAFAFTISDICPLKGMSEIFAGAKFSLAQTATIMYTSGSEGVPKGAMLTHRNILTNIWQTKHHVNIKDDEKVLGIAPFCHSLGFTLTLWAVLCLGVTVVFHTNGMEGRTIGKLVEQHGITLVVATPSVMRTWLPRITREQFVTVHMLLLGAEKLQPELARDIFEKLGIHPSQGYGCTELSPVVSATVPGMVQALNGEMVDGDVLGSVGMAVPGTDIAVVDFDTGELLPVSKEGLIFARGAQVMAGYFNKPEETAAVLRDGWYYTGDVGIVDAMGNIQLTDRMYRIIKMGGEWVPLMRIEAAIRQVTGITELDVISGGVPDPVKGQRPVVLFTDLRMDIAEVCRRLPDTGLPVLWVPKAKDFHQVEALPIGTTGKLNLNDVKRLVRVFAAN